MNFILYVIIVIVISLVNIIVENTIMFTITVTVATLLTIAFSIQALKAGAKFIKYLSGKFLLASIYLPIIIYLIFKLSIFLIDYFDKFNPPC